MKCTHGKGSIACNECKDNGHEALLNDLESLTLEARDYAFHDFKNTKYAVPKVALHNKLLVLAERVKNGNYDN